MKWMFHAKLIRSLEVIIFVIQYLLLKMETSPHQNAARTRIVSAKSSVPFIWELPITMCRASVIVMVSVPAKFVCVIQESHSSIVPLTGFSLYTVTTQKSSWCRSYTVSGTKLTIRTVNILMSNGLTLSAVPIIMIFWFGFSATLVHSESSFSMPPFTMIFCRSGGTPVKLYIWNLNTVGGCVVSASTSNVSLPHFTLTGTDISSYQWKYSSTAEMLDLKSLYFTPNFVIESRVQSATPVRSELKTWL